MITRAIDRPAGTAETLSQAGGNVSLIVGVSPTQKSGRFLIARRMDFMICERHLPRRSGRRSSSGTADCVGCPVLRSKRRVNFEEDGEGRMEVSGNLKAVVIDVPLLFYRMKSVDFPADQNIFWRRWTYEKQISCGDDARVCGHRRDAVRVGLRNRPGGALAV